jgi:hypothetical protein
MADSLLNKNNNTSTIGACIGSQTQIAEVNYAAEKTGQAKVRILF